MSTQTFLSEDVEKIRKIAVEFLGMMKNLLSTNEIEVVSLTKEVKNQKKKKNSFLI